MTTQAPNYVAADYAPAPADHGPGPAGRIRFGDGPAQDLPPILAEAVLRLVWAKSPAQFGNLLRQAMINTWTGPASDQNGAGK
jgi:hypothetical protein